MKIALIVVALLLILAVTGVVVFVFVIQNVERPNYATVTREDAFELRDYPALVVAEATRTGSREKALSAGFRPLAGYIFAKDRRGERVAMTAPVQQQAIGPEERIAMTAPVIQSSTGVDSWTVQFIMPSAYSLEDLPRPGGAEVRLRELPPRRVAAVRFSGRTNDERLAEQEGRLRAWMSQRELEPAGPPTYAYYNDPRTPGFLRRNEILIPVGTTPE